MTSIVLDLTSPCFLAAVFIVVSTWMRKTGLTCFCFATQLRLRTGHFEFSTSWSSVCPLLLCQRRNAFILNLYLSDFIPVFLLGHPYFCSSPVPIINPLTLYRRALHLSFSVLPCCSPDLLK